MQYLCTNTIFLQTFFLIIYFIIQYWQTTMSKIHKKQKTPLKFDTSSANIGCFIRGKSKQKISELDRYGSGFKSKRRSRYSRQKQIEFQDKAFLSSVVCKILNDVDCVGITDLIDDMIFPSNTTSQIQNNKETCCDDFDQDNISQIFSNQSVRSGIRNFNENTNPYQIYEHYRVIPPIQMNNREVKQECRSTFPSSMVDSMNLSPRSMDQTNPQVINGINSVIPIGYGYNYYPQAGYLYQRQPSLRKKKTTSGQQTNQYKIVPEKIEFDGRTTLMIRHIPNKYSEQMLFQEIGKNYKMKINFLYLPIDHYNTCNVGYAFVNFIHSKFISEFYKEFSGRRWDRFNSQKICELAYARIQGTVNLMDHFQNSTGNQFRGKGLGKSEEKKDKGLNLTQNNNLNIRPDFQKIEDH